MPSLRFTGTVEKGRLVMDDPQGWRSYLSSLVGKRFELSIQQWRKKRTLSQNAYLWRGIYPYFDTGHSKEEIHAAMKELHCPRKEVTVNGERVLVKSTTLLSVQEMSEYIETVKSWGQERGVRFPDPSQVGDL